MQQRNVFVTFECINTETLFLAGGSSWSHLGRVSVSRSLSQVQGDSDKSLETLYTLTWNLHFRKGVTIVSFWIWMIDIPVILILYIHILLCHVNYIEASFVVLFFLRGL